MRIRQQKDLLAKQKQQLTEQQRKLDVELTIKISEKNTAKAAVTADEAAKAQLGQKAAQVASQISSGSTSHQHSHHAPTPPPPSSQDYPTPTVMATPIQQPVVQKKQSTAMYDEESQQMGAGMRVTRQYEENYIEEQEGQYGEVQDEDIIMSERSYSTPTVMTTPIQQPVV